MKRSLKMMGASLILATSMFAQQQSGLYVGAGLGVEAAPKDFDSGLGLALKGGIHLDQVLANLGAEVELNKSLSDPSFGPVKIDVLTLAGYMTYTIKFPNSPLSVRPKFGVILPNLGDSKSVNSRDFGLSTGIAGVLQINKNLNAYLDYTNMGEVINNYSVGVEFNF